MHIGNHTFELLYIHATVIKGYLYLKYLIRLLDPKIKIKYVNMIMKLPLQRNVISKRKLKPLNKSIRI